MIPLKIKKTRRKFYGKWLYKVSLGIGGSSIFRTKDLLSIISFCSTDAIGSGDIRPSYMAKSWNNREVIYKLACVLTEFEADKWTKRIESNIFDFYTNEEVFFNRLISLFPDNIRLAYKPNLDELSLTSNPYTIISNRLPHGRYAYKVFLYPHNLEYDDNSRNLYISWIESQDTKIKISNSVKDWIRTCRWNWDRRYVLVEDEKTLMMLKLRDPSVVGRTYKYVVPKNKVNNNA